MRVIVCGSRTWSNERQIAERLRNLPADSVLVHGACPRGADFIAAQVWDALGRHDEPNPADWKRFGRIAGPLRNETMACKGADLCIAFRAAGKSNGTDHMIKLAKQVGIPVEIVEEVTP